MGNPASGKTELARRTYRYAEKDQFSGIALNLSTLVLC